MNFIATSSIDLLELSKKVDESLLLSNQSINYYTQSLTWGLGAVTVIVTVLIALFLAIQFGVAKKLQKKEIEDLKELLNKEFSEIIKNEINNELDLIKSDLMETKNTLNFEVSRLLAISAHSRKLYEKSFFWWLLASKYCDTDYVNETLKGAELALSKIKPGLKVDIDNLKEDIVSIEEALDVLSKRQKMRTDEIKKNIQTLLASQPK